jgi:hypothetical protein
MVANASCRALGWQVKTAFAFVGTVFVYPNGHSRSIFGELGLSRTP